MKFLTLLTLGLLLTSPSLGHLDYKSKDQLAGMLSRCGRIINPLKQSSCFRKGIRGFLDANQGNSRDSRPEKLACSKSNFHGKYAAGGGCNVHGCWYPGGGCNFHGCWKPGGECNIHGCASEAKKTDKACDN